MRDEFLPESMAGEIDAIWTRLEQSGLHCTAVTSALPDEGATAVAAALARRAVLAGRQTLLAEICPAQPRLAARLGLELQAGVPVRVGADGLGVVSIPADAGGDWRDPGYLGWQMAAWQRDWSMVVLDTPPLLAPPPAEGIGGLAVAARAATTLLVVLAGRTKAETVRQAQEKLLRAGGQLAGVVLNDRENPSLREEIEREFNRLGRLAPNLMRRLRARLLRSRVLAEEGRPSAP